MLGGSKRSCIINPFFFFQAEDGIRDRDVTGVQRVLFRSLDAPLTAEQKAAMIEAAAHKMAELLDILRIDHRSDPNTYDTPRRVARMYVDELLAGRYSADRKSVV